MSGFVWTGPLPPSPGMLGPRDSGGAPGPPALPVPVVCWKFASHFTLANLYVGQIFHCFNSELLKKRVCLPRHSHMFLFVTSNCDTNI